MARKGFEVKDGRVDQKTYSAPKGRGNTDSEFVNLELGAEDKKALKLLWADPESFDDALSSLFFFCNPNECDKKGRITQACTPIKP